MVYDCPPAPIKTRIPGADKPARQEPPLITDPWFYAAAVPAVLLFGIAKGGFGGGLGVLAVPLMALTVSPVQAAAVLLPILCLMDLVGLWAYRGRWLWPELRLLVPASMIGIAVGTLLFGFMSAATVRIIVGFVAIAFTGRLCFCADQTTWLHASGVVGITDSTNPVECGVRDSSYSVEFTACDSPHPKQPLFSAAISHIVRMSRITVRGRGAAA